MRFSPVLLVGALLAALLGVLSAFLGQDNDPPTRSSEDTSFVDDEPVYQADLDEIASIRDEIQQSIADLPAASTIRLIVSNEAGVPVQGASVLQSTSFADIEKGLVGSQRTDESGSLDLGVAEPVWLVASKPGYQSMCVSPGDEIWALQEGGVARLELARPVEIQVSVSDVRGAPISGAVCQIYGPWGKQDGELPPRAHSLRDALFAERVTDAVGRAMVPWVEAGRSMEIEAEGYAREVVRIKGNRRTVEVRLGRVLVAGFVPPRWGGCVVNTTSAMGSEQGAASSYELDDALKRSLERRIGATERICWYGRKEEKQLSQRYRHKMVMIPAPGVEAVEIELPFLPYDQFTLRDIGRVPELSLPELSAQAQVVVSADAESVLRKYDWGIRSAASADHWWWPQDVHREPDDRGGATYSFLLPKGEYQLAPLSRHSAGIETQDFEADPEETTLLHLDLAQSRYPVSLRVADAHGRPIRWGSATVHRRGGRGIAYLSSQWNPEVPVGFLEAGSYDLTVATLGFQPVKQRLSITGNGASVEIAVTMLPRKKAPNSEWQAVGRRGR